MKKYILALLLAIILPLSVYAAPMLNNWLIWNGTNWANTSTSTLHILTSTTTITSSYLATDGNGVIIATTTPSGGAAVWGSITGTLSNQTDLQNALNAKLSTTSAAATYQVIGSYLTNLLGGLNAILGNSTTTNATTTNLAITGLPNSILSTNALGQVVATTTVAGGEPLYAAASSTLLRFGTTSDTLVEGLINLFWTNNRFDTRLAATTSLPNLATLAGLSTIGSSTGQTTILGKTLLTNATTTTFAITGVHNSYLAVDANGSVISTTTSTTGTILSGTSGQLPYYSTNGDTLSATSSILLQPSSLSIFSNANNDDRNVYIGDTSFVNPAFQFNLNKLFGNAQLYMQGRGDSGDVTINAAGDSVSGSYEIINNFLVGSSIILGNDGFDSGVGDISVQTSSTTKSGVLDFSKVLTTSKSFIFPNWTGGILVSSSTSLYESTSTGNIGIGTSTPNAKLVIATGDVYVSSSTRGVILTSPDGTCHQGTISNINVLTFATVACP